jgi:hypothetical protein
MRKSFMRMEGRTRGGLVSGTFNTGEVRNSPLPAWD